MEIPALDQSARARRFAAAGAALASAAVMAAAQSFPGCGWLVLAGAVPLCFALGAPGFLANWALLAIFHAAYTALTLSWIRETGAGFGWLIPATVLYAALLAALPAAAIVFVGRRATAAGRLMLLPSAWALAELLSRRVLPAFSWALLGQPLADYPAVAQIAALAGPESLTFLALGANVAIAIALQPRLRPARFAALMQGPALLLLALALGALRLYEAPAAPTRKIAVVQPCISQQIRWDRLENRPPLLARMNRLIDEAAAQSPDLIVLPEGALPGLVRFERDLADFSTDAVRRTGVPLLFGSIDRDGFGRLYNSAFLITPDGGVSQYHKMRLDPFVERTPWPFRFAPPEGWAQFTPGTERALMHLSPADSFAPAIWLEDAHPDLAADAAARGAQWMVSLVNGESFQNTSQPLAHLRRARLSAISAGLPMLRAANTGISCSIDAHGRLLGALRPGVEQAAVLPASRFAVNTVYGVAGDLGELALLALALALAARWAFPRPARTPAPRRARRWGRRRRSAGHPQECPSIR